MAFVVEPISDRDIDECIQLLSSMASETIPTSTNREALKTMIYAENLLSLVARKGRRIVALISGALHPSLHINFLIVADEESARQGVGGTMIDKFSEIGVKRVPSARYAATSLLADNTAAVALYSSKGFRVQGFLKEGMMSKDMVLLRKTIQK